MTHQIVPILKQTQSLLRLVEGPYLLLDAFKTVVLALTGDEDASAPFPPPRGSLLRREADELAARRVPTPELRIVTRARLDAELSAFLFEDSGVRLSEAELRAVIGHDWATEELADSCHPVFLTALDILTEDQRFG